MPTSADIDFRIEISDDRLRAELIVPPDYSITDRALPRLRETIEDAHLPWTNQHEDRLKKVLARRDPRQPFRVIIARGAAPQPGEHGRVLWSVEQNCDADRDKLSHYERSAFTFVEPEQILGRIIPPTPGTPGHDVTGQTIPAAPGAPAELQLDDSIARRPGGDLVARRRGRFVRQGDAARIEEVLEVQAVDFSTGHIDFRGSIRVREGVKDCFHIKATGHIEIHGLVEAAQIDCGGNLILEGGFAGRDQGSARVAGNFHARYLDGVQAEVFGDLVLAREAMNSRLIVHGNADLTRGAVRGGSLAVGRTLHVASVGSAAGVTTELILGCVPRLDPMLEQLLRLRRGYLDQIIAIEQQEKKILDLPQSQQYNPTHQRRLSKFTQMLASMRNQVRRADEAAAILRSQIAASRTVDAHIHKTLFAGVLVRCAGQELRIFQPLLGPFRIALDHDGQPVFHTSSGRSQPLASIAEPQRPAA